MRISDWSSEVCSSDLLRAPIRAPGLFKCAFGYVGVYDIEMMFDLGDIPQSESGRRFLRRTHGTSKAKWNESSPVRRADEVDIPVYLAAEIGRAACRERVCQ